jgi:hypothetical protein
LLVRKRRRVKSVKHPITVRVPTSASLTDQSRGRGGLVLPIGRQVTDSLVVPRQSMNTGLDQNQSKLGITILSVTLKMLSDRHGLFDKLIQVLGDFWGESIGFQDTLEKVRGRGSRTKILFPVTFLTWAIPWESRRTTPI